MKLPSLFKTPRYQRFHVTPRYYDPVKEEIDARTSRIKSIVDADKDVLDSGEMPQSRISGSFVTKKRKGVNMTQPVIILLLVGLLVGYWYFGNIALYTFGLISSVLLYLKIKRII